MVLAVLEVWRFDENMLSLSGAPFFYSAEVVSEMIGGVRR